MVDFFLNVQESAGGGGGGAAVNGYTYNEDAYNSITPTHLLVGTAMQGVTSEFRIYDIQSLPTITQVSAWNPSGYTNYMQNIGYIGHRMSIKDGYFYMTTYNNELHVYDVTDPTSVASGSKIYDSGANATLYQNTVGLYAHPTKDILWVLKWDSSSPTLTTLDISNPASPSVISTITPYGAPEASAISTDGERIFYKTAKELVSYGLDASNNPANFQSDPTSGGSFAVSNNLRAQGRMEFYQSGTGNNYIIVGHHNLDNHSVIKMGTDYVPDAAASELNSLADSDYVKLVYPFPWAETYFSDDLVYWKQEMDDYELQVSSFDPVSNAFSHHGSIVDTTYLGKSSTGTVIAIDGWDQYVVTMRHNNNFSFWEYDPVADSVSRIASITRSTTPDIQDWAGIEVCLFAVP